MSATRIIRTGDKTRLVKYGPEIASAIAETDAARVAALAAQTAAESAQTDAEAAEAAAVVAQGLASAAALTAPDVYATKAAGLAAVAEGETFWSDEDGGVNLYRDVSGVATLIDGMASSGAVEDVVGGLEIRPKAYVIEETNGADNTSAIQAEIVDLMYTATGNARSRKLQLMTGTSTLTDTIHLGYGDAEFRGIWLYGEGNSYGGNLDQHAGTVLACTHDDRPGINIQGARNSGIKDIYLEGVGVDEFLTITADFDASDPLSAFTSALTGVSVTTGLQYAPYSGITIDAYSGTAPGTAYPNVTFPAEVGAPAQYGKTHSSLITLDNVTVKGFEVGCTFKPCDTSSQGDWLKTAGQVQFENCIYGLSIGNNQFRSSIVSPIRFRSVHTCLVTNKHGEQSGRAPTEMYIETSSLAYQLFEFGSLNAITSCHIHGNCETLVRLGEIAGGGSSGAGVLKMSGKFNFLDSETSQVYGVPAKLLEGSLDFGPVIYDAPEHEIYGAHYHEPPGVQAKNLYIKQGEDATKDYMQMGYNALSGGFLGNISQDRAQEICFIPYEIGTGASSPQITTSDYSYTDRDYCIPIAVKRGKFSSGLSGWFEKQNRLYPAYVVGAPSRISSYSRTDRSISWINDRLSGEDVGAKRNLTNGCIAFHDATATIAVIRSNDPSTGAQTLELLNNYIYNGSGFDLIDTSTAFTAGNWYFFPGHLFSPPKRIWGDITSGSGVITNVRTDGGADVTDYGLAVGDRLAGEYYDQDYQTVSSSSSNQPITAIDTAANTITVGRNCSVTQTGVPLDFWFRAEPANEASR
ncbi:hypothetical protein [Erythrobacter sp.]|uniref:hypothetical protein n=4 Tax=Sphingomonadales TaxID=204457 RepID=UPI0032670239